MAPTPCIPCCLVVTDRKLLTCHQDCQTSFFRSLGSADICDVTTVCVEANKEYCVIVSGCLKVLMINEPVMCEVAFFKDLFINFYTKLLPILSFCFVGRNLQRIALSSSLHGSCISVDVKREIDCWRCWTTHGKPFSR